MHSLECSVSRTPIKKRNKVEKFPDKIILFINFGFNSEKKAQTSDNPQQFGERGKIELIRVKSRGNALFHHRKKWDKNCAFTQIKRGKDENE